MSVQIDTSNYEAFYLDYLEGNLSGNALTAFEAFLAAHPELMLEDDSLATLPLTDETFDPVEKLALKKSIDLADLSTETVSFFLIAREENLLSQQQEAQLDNWLIANAYYRNDARLFALAKVQPDTQEVFEGKTALKRGQARIIPMWFTGAAAAAGLALIITLGIQNGSTPSENSTTVARNDSTPAKKRTEEGGQQRTFINPGTTQQAHQSLARNENHIAGRPSKSVSSNRFVRQDIAKLEKIEARDLAVETPELLSLAGLYTPPAKEVKVSSNRNDLAWTPIEQMRNPIQPVTDKISSTLNTPVDLRTAKATKKRQGGFYLKIGKLEISHRSASL